MKDKEYLVWTVRIALEIKEWLLIENQKYKSWNLFFIELRKRYEEDAIGPKKISKKKISKS